jgi:hypothetical protein
MQHTGMMCAAAHIIIVERRTGTMIHTFFTFSSHFQPEYCLPLYNTCRKRFMFVSIDAAMASQLVTLKVIEKLQVGRANSSSSSSSYLSAKHMAHITCTYSSSTAAACMAALLSACASSSSSSSSAVHLQRP